MSSIKKTEQQQEQEQTEPKPYCPIPPCGKTNPNPLALIPWLPLPEWSLHTLLVMAQSHDYLYTVTGKKSLQIHIDGVWWKYLDMTGDGDIYRRPALKTFPLPPKYTTQIDPLTGVQVLTPREGASDTHFRCDVCGRLRKEHQLKYIRCGGPAFIPPVSQPARLLKIRMDDMMTYTVCAPCVSNGALTNSRRLGFRAEVLP